MDVILGVIGVVAVVIVLAAALFVRRLVGFIVNLGMVVVGAVLLLLAVFAGPLGLFDDVETIERLSNKFGLDKPAATEPDAATQDAPPAAQPADRAADDDQVPDLPVIEAIPSVDNDPAQDP